MTIRTVRVVMLLAEKGEWAVGLDEGERIVGASHEGDQVWLYIERGEEGRTRPTATAFFDRFFPEGEAPLTDEEEAEAYASGWFSYEQVAREGGEGVNRD